MSGPIAPEDVIAAAGFVGVVIAALGYHAMRSAVATGPRARMRQRVRDSVAQVGPAVSAAVAADAAHVDTGSRLLRRAGGGNTLAVQLVSRLKAQAEHMGGPAGVRTIALAAVLAGVAAIMLVRTGGLSLWTALAAAPAGAGLGGFAAFQLVTRRYSTRFLGGVPDALDLIVRAVRAGVPVVQAIVSAGRELPDPVGREFRLMGDALRLGLDQQDVLEKASARIGVADFRFFVVCLQLQRETGGPLADTLENLSNIIRSRREVRLKTRALTAQGRAASKIIAAVPFTIMGALQAMGGDYMEVLFTTERGQRLLTLAVGMIMTGLVIIARMTKLED